MSSISDADRLTAAVAMQDQARQRAHEVEDIEWRVNFSVWGFLAAVAYLMLQPPALVGAARPQFGPWSWLFGLLPVLHFTAVYRLNRSGYYWRRWVDFHRSHANHIMGVPDREVAAPRERQRFTWKHWSWVLTEAAATALGSILVGLLAK